MAADTRTLSVALDQVVDLLGRVDDDVAGRPTACSDWTVADLTDHVVAGTRNFARSVRGEDIDWSAPTPPVEGDRAAAMRRASDDLLAAWAAADDDAEVPPPSWQCCELAVHTWDLATALDVDPASLDPAVAEEGGAFMRPSLTDENRAGAFEPARDEPADADPYTKLAAFAGRDVRGAGTN